MAIFLELRWFFRQYKWRYAGAIAALVAISVLTLLPPWFAGKIIDAIQSRTLTAQTLTQWVFMIVAVGAMVYVLRFVWRSLLYGTAYQLGNVLRQRVYDHLTRMTPAFYQRYATGDLMARATNDINAVEMTAGEGVLSMVDGALTGVVVLLALSIFLNWQLTLLALVPWPIAGYYLWRVGNQLHDAFTQAQESFSRLNERTQESISSIRLVKAFAQQTHAANQFTHVAQQASAANDRVARVDAKYDPAILLTVGSSFLLSVAGGAWLIRQGDMTVGQLTTFTLYLGYLVWPMFAYGWMLNILERGNAAYTRIRELLQNAPDVDDKGTITTLASPAITMHIPSYSYSNARDPVLRHVDINIAAGTTLGIVGPVASGKSTLVNLLARFYDGDGVEITLGNKPLRDYSLAALRQMVAVVPQDPFLFSATVAENIALGKPDANSEEIAAAARIACVHDDILRFSSGYQTMVGERGLTLSGGQKQRIAIARALMRNASILILDDALSAVDVETETTILRFLKQHRQGSTNIIVSHRLSAVAHAEKIIVLKQGAVTESGTHMQLLAANGWYAQMYQYQMIERAVDAGK